jgi:hypothetical protein
VVGVAVAVGTVLTYRPAPQPMPSLFAMDGAEAEQLLEHDGYDVQVESAVSCEPKGLVLDSDPPAGVLVGHGQTVTLRTSRPSGGYCPMQALARADGWAFVEFAMGDGSPPMFTDTVELIVDGGEPVTVPADQVTHDERWADVFALVTTAAREASPTRSGMPTLHVDPTLPTETTCGVPRPAAMGERFALRLQVDNRAPYDEHGCPLTLDLYRSERVIDTVVVYTAKER